MLDTIIGFIVNLGWTMFYIIAIISYVIAVIMDRLQGRKHSKRLMWHRLTSKDNQQ